MSKYRNLSIENKLVRALAWTLSSMSLLNLIVDFKFISLLGKFKEWIEAYSMFIYSISSFLFGWIDAKLYSK